jgi:hypothetical protein
MCEYIYNISVAVTAKYNTGLLYNLYLYNEFAKSMVDAGLRKGDYVAACSPHIWDSFWASN